MAGTVQNAALAGEITVFFENGRELHFANHSAILQYSTVGTVVQLGVVLGACLISD
jgi:hypothetical protein